MPEALAVVAVLFVCVVIYVALWVQSRNPALHDPRREQARLERHLKWLEERLAAARREGWGHEMTGNLTADLAATTEQLAQVKQQLAATEAKAA